MEEEDWHVLHASPFINIMLITGKSFFYYILMMHIIWIIFFLFLLTDNDFAIAIYIIQIILTCKFLGHVALNYIRNSLILCIGIFLFFVIHVLMISEAQKIIIGYSMTYFISGAIFCFQKYSLFQKIIRKQYPYIMHQYDKYDVFQIRDREIFLDSELNKKLNEDNTEIIKIIVNMKNSVYVIGFLHFESIVFCIGTSFLITDCWI